jgi:hypothetical protein
MIFFFCEICKMAGHNSILTIEKLQGWKNYTVWKTQMRFYLVHEKLWDLVSTEPAAGDTGAADRKRDLRALSKIGLLVRPKCPVHPQAVETTKVAWEALQSAVEDKGVNR